MTINKKEVNNHEVRKLILYPVISGVILMLVVAVVAWFTTVGDNTKRITSLEASKVDVESFNTFLRMYTSFTVLTEERVQIQTATLTALGERQRKIELDRLLVIEKNIEILKQQMKALLQQYGFYTRDGGEMIVNPLFLIETVT